MKLTRHESELSRRVHALVRDEFIPHYGEQPAGKRSEQAWKTLRETGSQLWLDSGDAEGISRLWTQEFSALTTNNTLLNKEVQKGTYDAFIAEAAALLDEFPDLSAQERRLELAFMLNARHGLSLVQQFDAFVSVEEHTMLAHDLAGAVNYARRFHAICPERFYVKIPLTAAGILATRRVAAEGIPVNHTLGFSARQNYLITRIGNPAYVNVFLGRLNSVTADNGLGSGNHVGEKATLATQNVILRLRSEQGLPTRLIAASLRQGGQVADLAGVDVMTIPLPVAEEFLGSGAPPTGLARRGGEACRPDIAADASWARFDTLWDVTPKLVQCVDRLAKQDLDAFTSEDLVTALDEEGCGDVLVCWTDEQIATSAEEGKIPKLEHWRDLLESKRIGLDSLMNLAGLNSFTADQADMDRHVTSVLEG